MLAGAEPGSVTSLIASQRSERVGGDGDRPSSDERDADRGHEDGLAPAGLVGHCQRERLLP